MIYANLFVITLTVCFAIVTGQKERELFGSQEGATDKVFKTGSPSFTDTGVAKENKFSSEYTIVTSKSNFQVNYKLFPDPTTAAASTSLTNFVLGSAIVQSGNVFRPNSINLVQVLQNFAGGVQPETTPDLNSAFTFNGECIATGGVGLAVLTAHTCVYNLCLRGSQNCIFLYAGTAFNFDAAPGLTRQAPAGTPLVGFDVYVNSGVFAVDATPRVQNPLPPSFPGVIIGGCNDFSGITGNFDLITVAGTAPYSPQIGTSTTDGKGGPADGAIARDTFAPTTSPTTNFPTVSLGQPEGGVGGNDLNSIFPSELPTGKPTFQGSEVPTAENLEPAIVQKLYVKSNIRLPKAPKATGANNEQEANDER